MIRQLYENFKSKISALICKINELIGTFEKREVFSFLIVVMVFFATENILDEIFKSSFDSYVIPVIKTIRPNIVSNILFVVIGVYCVYKIIQCCVKKYILSWKCITLIFIVSYFYFKHRQFDEYIYYPADCKIAYSDVIIYLLSSWAVVCVVMFIINCINFLRRSYSNEDPYLLDHPIFDVKDDILDYDEDAKVLAGKLEKMSREKSFSIGICASWGYGKTSYLNLLKKAFNGDKVIVVEFNPRHSKNYSSIQEDFFILLSSSLRKYNSSFSIYVDLYMDVLDIDDKTKVIRKLFLLFSKYSSKDIKWKIDNVLSRLHKKVVVFIDDFDRLMKDEIIEVFKLIDGNANFRNIIFISAYDKESVNVVLTPQNGVSYCEKFFSMEKNIPIRPYDKTFGYLKDAILNKIDIDDKLKIIYDDKLNNYIDIFKSHLLSLRDVKRFVNLFIEDYLLMKEEVLFEDYLLLSLIKYKFPKEHKELYKRQYVKFDGFTEDIGAYNFSPEKCEDKNSFTEILEVLFPLEKNDSVKYRSIRSAPVFDIYFHNAVYSSLSIKELSLLFDLDKDFAYLIYQWHEEKKMRDVIEFIKSKNVLAFENKEKFERYLFIVLYGAKENYFDLVLKSITLVAEKAYNKVYEYKEGEVKKIIIGELKGDKKYHRIIAELLIHIINKDKRPESTIIFSKDELLDINKKYLSDYFSDKENIPYSEYEGIFKSCISDVSNDIIVLDKWACQTVKDYIIKYPDSFLEKFVRTGMTQTSSPDYDIIACEPYWEQIFDTADEFEKFLRGISINKAYLLRVNNFWELYKNNDFNVINSSLKGNVQEKIDKNLVEERKMLDEIIRIEEEFKGFREPTIDDLQSLLNRLRQINLEISILEKVITNIVVERARLEQSMRKGE